MSNARQSLLMRRRIKVADSRIYLVSAAYIHIREEVVDCLPQRKGRCCNESHTSSQTPTQLSSQTTPQASNIPSLGSACVGNQDTQPPTQPSPDNEMAHETSDQRSVADNSGMSSLTDNNGMLGAGPEQQD